MARQFLLKCKSLHSAIWAHAPPGTILLQQTFKRPTRPNSTFPRTTLDRNRAEWPPSRRTPTFNSPSRRTPTFNWETRVKTSFPFLIPHKWSATAASTRLAGPVIREFFF